MDYEFFCVKTKNSRLSQATIRGDISVEVIWIGLELLYIHLEVFKNVRFLQIIVYT